MPEQSGLDPGDMSPSPVADKLQVLDLSAKEDDEKHMTAVLHSTTTRDSETDVCSDSETAEKLEPSQASVRLVRWRLWIAEIILCLVSLTSFLSRLLYPVPWLLITIITSEGKIAIIVVLTKYDGTPMLRLPFDITLNTFLSFLTSLTKAAFMVPVAEAIGQWKRNSNSLYSDGHPISDLAIIDKASRGTLGSLSLMRHFKLR